MARPKKSNVGNGFEKSPRTIEQVTNDYNSECCMVGHKSRLIKQCDEDIERLEAEIKAHLDTIVKLNAEGMKLQAVLRAAQPQVTPAQAPLQSEGAQDAQQPA